MHVLVLRPGDAVQGQAESLTVVPGNLSEDRSHNLVEVLPRAPALDRLGFEGSAQRLGRRYQTADQRRRYVARFREPFPLVLPRKATVGVRDDRAQLAHPAPKPTALVTCTS